MFNETENQTDESQQAQNSALSQDSENLEGRIEGLNQNGNKLGKRKKNYSIIIAILILIFVGSAIAGGYYFRDDLANFLNLKEEAKKVDCAMDKKECPDGSFVSRIYPNCEFAECPVVKMKNEIDERIYCEIDNDCLATCLDPGCYNKNWYETKMRYDCEAVIKHTCKCMDNECKHREEQNKIGDLRTYRNEEFGFEFKYSEEVNKIEEINKNTIKIKFIQDISLNSRDKLSDFEIEILKIAEPLPEIPEMINIGSSKTPQYLLVDGIKSKEELFKGKYDGTQYYFRVYVAEKNILYHSSFNSEFLIVAPMMKDMLSTFKFLKDTDNDGLFDDEEAKYGCDINNPDSDGDGYLDGDEVKNGYDPNGEGKL